MKILSIGLILGIGVSLLAAPNWKNDMLKFRSNLLNLAPYIYSSSEFSNKANAKKIKSHLEAMAKTGHKLRPDISKKLSEKDPSVNYIIENLKNDIELAKDSFSEKKFSYSQNVLKSAINRCFQCHSQNFGAKQTQSEISPKSIKLLNPMEQADLLVALRNFNKANELLEERLSQVKFTKANQYEIENLVHKYLLVSLRTNRDPKKITFVLDKLKEDKKLPKYIKKKIESYEDSLAKIKTDKRIGSLDNARKLIKSANKKKDYTYDASGLVESIKASQLLHSYIQTSHGSKKELAEAFFLLGQAYQSMNEPAYWDLHESYFARCVQSLPKSHLAKSCFKRYKDSVEFRHSGSSGMHIPLRLKFRLSDLKDISGTK